MTTYRVGEDGASVFDADGHLVARLRPGATIVPGTRDETIAPRSAEQQAPTRRQPGPCTPGYADKVIRPERGPAS